MNLEEKRKQLEKHIEYIKTVLKEKQDELFCVNIEIKKERDITKLKNVWEEKFSKKEKQNET